MEITNETKTKVFAQYLGQEFIYSYLKEDVKYELDTERLNLINDDEDWDNCKLILKPLSKITDEDAVEVAKMLNFNKYHSENGKAFLKQLLKGEEMMFNFHPLNTLSVFQFLISKGYDLPNYHLDGKTLHEAGLAIYE